MAKKTIEPKEPVKLREKVLANGSRSLYLDIYRNGKRHKEYLKLYLFDAKNRTAKPWQQHKLLRQSGRLRFKTANTPLRDNSRKILLSLNIIVIWLKRDERIQSHRVIGETGVAVLDIWNYIVMNLQLSGMSLLNLFQGSSLFWKT